MPHLSVQMNHAASVLESIMMLIDATRTHSAHCSKNVMRHTAHIYAACSWGPRSGSRGIEDELSSSESFVKGP